MGNGLQIKKFLVRTGMASNNQNPAFKPSNQIQIKFEHPVGFLFAKFLKTMGFWFMMHLFNVWPSEQDIWARLF